MWLADISACTSTSKGLGFRARIAVVVADVLVLMVTWLKTFQAYMEARRAKIRTPLGNLLLRDGDWLAQWDVFVPVSILLALNIFVPIANSIPSLVVLNITGPIIQILPSIIILRFILNLRQASSGLGSSSGSYSHGLSSGFSSRFMGNMGQSLQFEVNFGEDEDEKDDDEHYSGGASLIRTHTEPKELNSNHCDTKLDEVAGQCTVVQCNDSPTEV
ncbi:hypothetical protein BDY19DRAFT_971798 [Irpex rosettiformis]|uniref:Uncharacterized protein n=1 Tax=Irpex rosettiformis TaxID=378272 RepID=A0ACB8TQX1_9APHY|nr:hypothetical protein BDY19DRAFT_971798 [Irpex rosettiformis]